MMMAGFILCKTYTEVKDDDKNGNFDKNKATYH